MLGAGDAKTALLHFLGGHSLVEENGKHDGRCCDENPRRFGNTEQQHLTQNGGTGKGFPETTPELNLQKVKDILSMCQDRRTCQVWKTAKEWQKGSYAYKLGPAVKGCVYFLRSLVLTEGITSDGFYLCSRKLTSKGARVDQEG